MKKRIVKKVVKKKNKAKVENENIYISNYMTIYKKERYPG